MGAPSISIEDSGAVDYAKRAVAPAIALDARGRILAINHAACELLETPGREILGKSFDEALQPRDVFGNRLFSSHTTFTAMALRGEPVHRFDIALRKGAADAIRVQVSVVVLYGTENAPDGVVYLLSPIRRRRRADEVIERALQGEGSRSTFGHVAGEMSDLPQLTQRQVEVLRLLADGASSIKISRALNISAHTVRTHIQNIYSTLGVHNAPQAVLVAVRNRIL